MSIYTVMTEDVWHAMRLKYDKDPNLGSLEAALNVANDKAAATRQPHVVIEMVPKSLHKAITQLEVCAL